MNWGPVALASEGPDLPSFSSVLSPESGLSSTDMVLSLLSCFVLFPDEGLFPIMKLSSIAQLEPVFPFRNGLYGGRVEASLSLFVTLLDEVSGGCGFLFFWGLQALP